MVANLHFNLSWWNQIVCSLVGWWSDSEIGRKVSGSNPHRGELKYFLVACSWQMLAIHPWKFALLMIDLRDFWCNKFCFFPTYFPTFFFSYRYKMQIKGAMNLLSVQRKGRSTFRKRFSNADIQRYMKIVHILDHWSMEITRKWDGHIYKYNLSLTATEKWQYHWVQWNRSRL